MRCDIARDKISIIFTYCNIKAFQENHDCLLAIIAYVTTFLYPKIYEARLGGINPDLVTIHVSI